MIIKLPNHRTAGVIRSPELRPATLATTPVSPYAAWTKYAIPSQKQHYGSCVGESTANWLEIMLRKHLGRDVFKDGQQINGEAIWRQGRKMFYPKESIESGGLLMDHGLRAAIALGILPPDTGVVTVHLDVGMLSRMLRNQPVLQGTGTHDNWAAANRENGYITPRLPEPYAGHATVIIGVIEQDAEPYVLFQNSWGAKWGMGGYGLLRADHWSQSLLGPLVVAKLPDNWVEWNGWRDFVIEPRI